MNFNIENKFDSQKDIWIIKLNGDLDIFSSDYFKEEILKLWKEKNLDLHIYGDDLEYIDSTGLGALIGLNNEIKMTGNKIFLYNLKSNIKKLFVITDLDEVFNIGDSR